MRINHATQRRTTLTAAALCLAAAAASAGTLRPVTFQERVTRADLIADLTVVGIDSRLAMSGLHGGAVPHTFVTFEVNRLIKGDVEGGQVTLRFMGGTDESGGKLTVHGVPEFRVGDRDLLFVEGNEEKMCPLVGWEQGRFRVVGGDVFNHHGQELWVTADDRLLAGESSLDTRAQPYRIEADGSGDEDPQRFEPPAGATRPDAVGFTAVLDELVGRAYALGLMAPPAMVRSADADAPFAGRLPLASPAPQVKDSDEGALFEGEYDAAEAELIRRQGGQ